MRKNFEEHAYLEQSFDLNLGKDRLMTEKSV